MRASAEMKEYFVGILADQRKAPKDDMVSILAGAEINGVKMSDEQIYGFMRNLLPAGAETTSRSTASLAMGLLTHPDQLDAVREDRGLLPQAIEEGIRWETPLLNFMREVTCDTELAGVALPKGATMMLSLGSANHDETRWDDPEILRHLPGTQAAHRIRAWRSCVPRHAPGPAGEHQDLQCAVRRTAGAAARPRCAGALRHRHDVPLAAAARCGVGLRGATMTRVIQWATGVTGMMSLRHVIGRPDLDLVGVRVYDPAKAGVDAGTLCGAGGGGVAHHR